MNRCLSIYAGTEVRVSNHGTVETLMNLEVNELWLRVEFFRSKVTS
jgi:hypothetical protein